MTVNVIPSPVLSDGMVYLASGFRGSALVAVDLDKAEGDITGTDAVVWSLDRDTPYTPTPVLYQGNLYFTKVNSNILTVVDAKTGEQRYQTRIDGLGDVFASLVAANGNIYITGREGTTTVIKAGNSYEVVSINELDDMFDASIAMVGDEIYLRGRNLYRISK